MFLGKYLNSTYLDLVCDNYEEDYLKLLDESNFEEVYMVLKKNGFYFIEDIILNYLELFEIDAKYVELALMGAKSVLREDYVKKIGKDMTLVDKIIFLANHYSEKDNN